MAKRVKSEPKPTTSSGQGDARAAEPTEGQNPTRGRLQTSSVSKELQTNLTTAGTSLCTNQKDMKQVKILANFVQLSPMPHRVVHKYRIEYEPQVGASKIMRGLFRLAHGQLFARRPIFDGAHECCSPQQLAERVVSVTVRSEEAYEQEHKVTFTNTGSVAFGPELVRIYSMQMKDFLRDFLGYHQPQPGLYVHKQLATELARNTGIMMVRGFRTAAKLHEGGKILMNLEAAHKLMQRENVLMFMKRIEASIRDTGCDLSAELERELVNRVVVASYRTTLRPYQAYRIEAVRRDLSPLSTFILDGRTTTYVEYYQQKYGKQIRDHSQSLLLVVHNNRCRRDVSERDIILVPELCNLVGLSEEQRSDDQLRQALIAASRISPTDQVDQMRQFLDQFHANENITSQLVDWGYSYASNAIELDAFVLPPSRFALGPTCKQPIASWKPATLETGDIQVDALAEVKAIKRMAFICCTLDLQYKETILAYLKGAFNQVGLKVNQVEYVDVKDGNRANNYVTAITRLDKSVECAVLVMDRPDKGRYDAIKKAASCQRGLITQVITTRLFVGRGHRGGRAATSGQDPRAKSAATKIAIQIAAKVGGQPWWVDVESRRGDMVCGYDTYHDTERRGRSFGAFLASMNVHFSRWWSKADAHDKLEEISAQVSANMVEAVAQYRKSNSNQFPERVFFYRDGVGDGQLEHVCRVELKQIQKALESLDAPNKIRLTMIIVNKRTGARFYQFQERNNFSNPSPGTVIDHTVTHRGRYDFYLVSQSTRLGTITPTYYNIIHDDNGLAPEQHQRMAYKLCLLYYNWSGTVRVPAPCQYAHKLALLCGEHLHDQPNAVLDDRLHFL